MSRIARALTLATVLALPGQGHAAKDGAEPPPDSSLELIVVESEGCRPCAAFRSHILPIYQASSHARRVPMRIVTLEGIEASGLKLDSPLEVLPTVLLLSNGAEIARLTGFIAPESFLTVVQSMLDRAE